MGIGLQISVTPLQLGQVPTRASPSTVPETRVVIPGTNAWLTTQQLRALQAGIDSGEYTIRVLAQNVAGQDHVAVILGERHEKSAQHAAIGEEIVQSFPRRACETVLGSAFMDFGAMVCNQFIRIVAKPFVFLKSRLRLSFKKRFFGSTIDYSALAAGHFFSPTNDVQKSLSHAVEKLRLTQLSPEAQEALRYRVSLQCENYERDIVLSGREIVTFLQGGQNPIACEPTPLWLEEGHDLAVYDKLGDFFLGAMGCLAPLLCTTGSVSVLSEIYRSLHLRYGEFSLFDRYVTMPIAALYTGAMFIGVWSMSMGVPHRDRTMAQNLVHALSQDNPEPLLAIVGKAHSEGIVEKSQPATREVTLPRVVIDEAGEGAAEIPRS